MKELSQAGKEEFALAILLWKDFKASGFNIDITRQAMEMATHLGVVPEFHQLLAKTLPFKITVNKDEV